MNEILDLFMIFHYFHEFFYIFMTFSLRFVAFALLFVAFSRLHDFHLIFHNFITFSLLFPYLFVTFMAWRHSNYFIYLVFHWVLRYGVVGSVPAFQLGSGSIPEDFRNFNLYSGTGCVSFQLGPGSIPGRDKFPGWDFSGFFLTCTTNVRKL